MKILFLDDEEYRHRLFRAHSVGHECKHVYNSKDAINALKNEKFDRVYLDHDLGEEHYRDLSGFHTGTGLDVADFIATMDVKPQVVIHSMNPVGAARMFQALDGKCIRWMFNPAQDPIGTVDWLIR